MTFNALLALTSMVINPGYYSNAEHKCHQQIQWLHATSSQYLSRVDEELHGSYLQKSLQAHLTSHLANPVKLDVEKKKTVGFQNLLSRDIEWALEFSRLIEKYMKVNLQ